jgi:hypothetical protein
MMTLYVFILEITDGRSGQLARELIAKEDILTTLGLVQLTSTPKGLECIGRDFKLHGI